MLHFSPNRCILTRRVSTQTENASKDGKLQHTNQTWHQKQTHRHRDQTGGWGWGGSGVVVWEAYLSKTGTESHGRQGRRGGPTSESRLLVCVPKKKERNTQRADSSLLTLTHLLIQSAALILCRWWGNRKVRVSEWR